MKNTVNLEGPAKIPTANLPLSQPRLENKKEKITNPVQLPRELIEESEQASFNRWLVEKRNAC